MQKWEYLYTVNNFDKYGKKVYRENGQELEGTFSVYDYINQKGKEGWEIISFSRSEAYETIVMKRPLTEKAGRKAKEE